jgi:hypothetical protein
MRDNETRASSIDTDVTNFRWNRFEDPSVSHAEGSPVQESKGTHTRQEKKPYTKPTYRYEQVFETMALACGKISATQFQCRFHRNAS